MRLKNLSPASVTDDNDNDNDKYCFNATILFLTYHDFFPVENDLSSSSFILFWAHKTQENIHKRKHKTLQETHHKMRIPKT